MLKKSITYEDVFTGDPITEDFYFNLSKADMVELEVSHKDGLGDRLQKLLASKDMPEIYAEFKKIVLKSYGQRSEDGKRFIKTAALREEFESSNAYSELLMEMMTVEGALEEFMMAVVPKGMLDDENQLKLPVVQTEAAQPKKLTIDDLAVIDADDLKTGLATGRYTL